MDRFRKTTGLLRTHQINKRRMRGQLKCKERQGALKSPPAIHQVVGYKNSGKTTLICALIPLLQQRGFKVAVIKHDTHGFDMDHLGTDTWRQREAGAAGIAITNNLRTVRLEERGSGLSELITSFAAYDYILIEGFKNEAYPKLVMIHEEEDLHLLRELSNVSAAVIWPMMKDKISTDGTIELDYFDINNSAEIAYYLWQKRSYFQNFNI